MSELNPFFCLEAEQLLLNKDYREAIELCKQGLEEFPDYFTGWSVLIKAYIKSEQIDLAKDTLVEAKNIFPNNPVLFEMESNLSQTKDDIQRNDNEENISNLKDETDEQEQIEVNKNIDEQSNDVYSESEEPIEEIEESKDGNIYQENSEDTEEIIVSDEEDTISTDNVEDNNTIDEQTEIEEETELQNINGNEAETINTTIDNESELEKKEEIDLTKGFLKKYIHKKIDKDYNPNSLIEKDLMKLNNISTEYLHRSSFRDVIIPENVLNQLKNISPNKDLSFETSLPDLDDDLTQLAKKLETAKITAPIEDFESPKEVKQNNEVKIVSETMANIYIQQGAYDAAEKAYKELLLQNPDKKQYYLDKLNNLNSKMK